MEAFFIVTLKVIGRGFPGGIVVEGWPASAGVMGSIPGQEGSHMPQSKSALCTTGTEPVP